MMVRRSPTWELQMILDVAERWEISTYEADTFLEEIGALSPEDEWPEVVTYDIGDRYEW